MEKQSELVLSSALEYAAMGWHVVPVDLKTKHPKLKQWQLEATTDENKIDNWWSDGSRFEFDGVFVTFGDASGIIDIDLDNVAHLPKLIEAFGGEMPVTLQFLSGGRGAPHFIFKYRSDLPQQGNVNLRTFGIDADLKIGGDGKGSGSVFPPSGKYKWQPGLSPNECDAAELPDTFIAWLHNSMTSGANVYAVPTVYPPSVRKQLYEGPGVVYEGQRDDVIYAESCAMWREQEKIHGLGAFDSPDCEVVVQARMWACNRARCVPPLDDDTVRAKVEGARQYIATQSSPTSSSGPQLTSLGLEFRDGEWFPGDWRVEVVLADPRRARLYAPFLPKPRGYIEMLLDRFDEPHSVHRAVLGATGTVCLAHKPGFWNGVWNGQKVTDPTSGRQRLTTGLKAKLLRIAVTIDVPPEQRRAAVIAGRVLDCLRRAGPPRKSFDPADVTAPVRDDQHNIWCRFTSLLEVTSMSDDRVTRNELSQCLDEFALQKQVRKNGIVSRMFLINDAGLQRLQEIANGDDFGK